MRIWVTLWLTLTQNIAPHRGMANQVTCQKPKPALSLGMFREDLRRVSEWLAATLEMSCRETGCGFESRALRSKRRRALAHPAI